MNQNNSVNPKFPKKNEDLFEKRNKLEKELEELELEIVRRLGNELGQYIVNPDKKKENFSTGLVGSLKIVPQILFLPLYSMGKLCWIYLGTAPALPIRLFVTSILGTIWYSIAFDFFQEKLSLLPITDETYVILDDKRVFILPNGTHYAVAPEKITFCRPKRSDLPPENVRSLVFEDSTYVLLPDGTSFILPDWSTFILKGKTDFAAPMGTYLTPSEGTYLALSDGRYVTILDGTRFVLPDGTYFVLTKETDFPAPEERYLTPPNGTYLALPEKTYFALPNRTYYIEPDGRSFVITDGRSFTPKKRGDLPLLDRINWKESFRTRLGKIFRGGGVFRNPFNSANLVDRVWNERLIKVIDSEIEIGSNESLEKSISKRAWIRQRLKTSKTVETIRTRVTLINESQLTQKIKERIGYLFMVIVYIKVCEITNALDPGRSPYYNGSLSQRNLDSGPTKIYHQQPQARPEDIQNLKNQEKLLNEAGEKNIIFEGKNGNLKVIPISTMEETFSENDIQNVKEFLVEFFSVDEKTLDNCTSEEVENLFHQSLKKLNLRRARYKDEVSKEEPQTSKKKVGRKDEYVPFAERSKTLKDLPPLTETEDVLEDEFENPSNQNTLPPIKAEKIRTSLPKPNPKE